MTDREFAKWRAERRRQEKEAREAGPKKAIMDYMASRGILRFRMPSGDIVVQVGARKRRIMGNEPGTADILAFVNLPEIMPLWIECKKSDGVQNSDQKSFQERVEKKGHSYIIARSVADVEKWLESQSIPFTLPQHEPSDRIGE
jgi:hypothetical protein